MKHITTVIFCSMLVANLAILFSIPACARKSPESDEDSLENLVVEGAFAEWYANSNPFQGGFFALLDATTNEVFSADIKSETNSFKIENVPPQGRYYGLVIGADFQRKASIKKTLADDKTVYNVFKLGLTQGHLGTLVLNNQALESSQQSELDFQTTLGVSESNNGKKTFSNEYQVNFTHNPDIDQDGIPNIIDSDVDGDDYTNAIDGQTYGPKSIADAKIPWQHNYGSVLPQNGFFKCDQLKSPHKDNPKNFIFTFWCVLKLQPNTAEKITLKSYGVTAEMFDNGGISSSSQQKNNDPIALDGFWNAKFTVDGSQTLLYPNQLLMAEVRLKNGTLKKYLTTLGPEFPYSVEFKADDTTKKPKITMTNDKIEADCIISHWPQSQVPKGLTLEILLLNADDTFVKIFSMPLGTGTPLTDGNSGSVFTLSDNSISELGMKAGSYKLKARVLAPASLPGLVGSATESATTEALPFPSQ